MNWLGEWLYRAWRVGQVERVSAITAALQLRWRNGALGTMAVTMLAYPKNLEGSITLLGASAAGVLTHA